MSYTYPPSEDILWFGKLEGDSHHYCEGIAIFDYGKPFTRQRCKFEVAYTEKSQVVIVCYFDGKYYDAALPFTNSIYFRCQRLIGREIKSGLIVVVEQPNFRRAIHSRGYRVWFHAGCFKSFLPDKIKNPAKKPSTYPPHFEIVGVDFQSRHTDFLDTPRVEFILDPENSLFLLVQKSKEEKIFDNQATCRFSYQFSKSLEGYQPTDIAGLWCSLMSLALGSDVQWTSYLEPDTNLPNLRKMQIWRSTQLDGATNLLSPIDLSARFSGITDWDNIKEFIVQCFRTVLNSNMSVEEIRSYTKVLRHYANYRLLKTSTEAGHARLISTLTEELLWEWEKFRSIDHKEIMTKGERNKLIKLLVDTLKKNPNEFLNEVNHQQLDKIADNVEELLKTEIRNATFLDGLKFFFSAYSIALDEQLINRFKAFIQTRNSIAHTGRFANKNPDISNVIQFAENEKHAVYNEINNSLMMIPLMIFTIFGYRGRYYDFLERKEKIW